MAGYRVVEKVEAKGLVVEIIAWEEFAGVTDIGGLHYLYLLRQGKFPVRQVRLTLEGAGTGVILEAGALQSWIGSFDVESKIPAGRLVRRFVGAAMTKEKAFRPRYRGRGTIWTEPQFGHFLLVGLDEETVIVDQGMFHCASDTIAVEAKAQSSVSAAIFGGEGLFQTQLRGSGIAVLTSPVPEEEIIKHTLKPGERLVVDGDFALLRSGNVAFSVGKSSRSWLGSAVSGEGLLQTFQLSGGSQGEVWVAPTLPVYEDLAKRAAMRPGGGSGGGSGSGD